MANATEPPKKEHPEVLRKEYDTLIYAYHERDRLVPQIFASLLQAFVFFTTIITAITVSNSISRADLTFLRDCVFLLTFLAGLHVLVIYILDVQATSGAKFAIRQRLIQIEETKINSSLNFWHVVVSRELRTLERIMLHPKNPKFIRDRVASKYIAASWSILVLWVVQGVLYGLHVVGIFVIFK